MHKTEVTATMDLLLSPTHLLESLLPCTDVALSSLDLVLCLLQFGFQSLHFFRFLLHVQIKLRHDCLLCRQLSLLGLHDVTLQTCGKDRLLVLHDIGNASQHLCSGNEAGLTSKAFCSADSCSCCCATSACKASNFFLSPASFLSSGPTLFCS